MTAVSIVYPDILQSALHVAISKYWLNELTCHVLYYTQGNTRIGAL